MQKLLFIFYSHVIWKFDEKCPLSLWCSSFPYPMLRRKSANCEDSPRSFALMFCVSCNHVMICQRYEDFSVASTISGLDPCRTTGKICHQFLAKSTVCPPNDDGFSECLALFCLLLVSHRKFSKFAHSITLRSDKNRDYV